MACLISKSGHLRDSTVGVQCCRISYSKQNRVLTVNCRYQVFTLVDPSEYARLSPGSQNYKKEFFLRTRSYRTMAATWGDCTIPSDQLTPRINGSGKTPITIVASAVTPSAQRIPRLRGSRSVSIGARISIEFAIFR